MDNAVQTLKPSLDTSIASKTAENVLHRVFGEVKLLAEATEHTDEWIENCLNVLRFSQDIEIGFTHSKATMLAIFRQVWNDLPYDFRKQNGFHFMNFAKIWTGGKAKSTIDAYTLTAKLWILDEYGKEKQVTITVRSPEGKPVLNESGAHLTKTVQFCPYNIDLTKLSILNPRVVDDTMTDRLWEMLVDPFYSCDDVRAEHHSDKKDGNGPQYVLKYDLSGPALIVFQNGNSAVVAPELNWEEYESNPLVKEAINNFLKITGVEMDEDKIFKLIRENYK